MLIGIFYSQIVESSSLVSVLFREVISHPYISFFHLLVNGFSVIIIIIIIIINFFRRVFPSITEASATLLISLDSNFSAIGHFGFSFSVWTKIRPCWLNNGWCAILIFTPPINTAHQLKEGKGSAKKYGNK